MAGQRRTTGNHGDRKGSVMGKQQAQQEDVMSELEAMARPRVSVIGTGYLGATHAAAVAELGFDVIGVDSDPAQIEALAAGRLPFVEPGLAELIQVHLASGRLRFTTDLAEA